MQGDKKKFRCKACGRRFRTPEAREQHKADTGHTNNPASAQPKFKPEFAEAMAMLPDDMPDGAFFAMASEIAGVEYGDWYEE